MALHKLHQLFTGVVCLHLGPVLRYTDTTYSVSALNNNIFRIIRAMKLRAPSEAQHNLSATPAMTYPTDSTRELLGYALDTLNRLFHEGHSYRKACVTFFGLVPADQLTMRMFDDTRRERFRKVMEDVDAIKRKCRWDTVRFAVARPDGIGKRKFTTVRRTTRSASRTCP